MTLYDSKTYMDDVRRVAAMDFPWETLRDKKILITGATGMIGSFLVDVVMSLNTEKSLNCTVLCLSRSRERAEGRFALWADHKNFRHIPYDINEPIRERVEGVKFALHLASNTHPVAYATDPIGTITTNIIGTKNILDFVVESGAQRLLFASSNEIYGENRGDQELFDESYCGYIDCNTLRAGYPESKRCGEALCQAYIQQKGADVVIARLTRSYGPTMLMTDTKALSQFIKKGIHHEDIVLKSAGTQLYSFTYVADAVAGLLTVLFKGETGEAYNIADAASNVTLRHLAETIAAISGTKVVFELPDSTESKGYSKATKALLDAAKLQQVGWQAKDTIETGLQKTLRILEEIGV